MEVDGSSAIARLSIAIGAPPAAGVVVTTAVELVAIESNLSTSYVGVADPVDFTGGSGRGCALSDNLASSAPMEGMLTAITTNGLSFDQLVLFERPMHAGDATITHTRTDRLRCDFVVDDQRRGSTYNLGNVQPVGTIGLFARNVTARYRYVFAYTD